MPPKYPSQAWDPGSAGALPSGTAFIGLATVTIGSGNATIQAVVTETSAPGYEDNVAGVAKVEQRFTPTSFTSVSTIAIDTTPGYLQGIWVGAVSCPSTILYNNTVPSGTVLTRIACGMPVGFHPFYGEYTVGLSVDTVAGGGGVNPFFTFLTRT